MEKRINWLTKGAILLLIISGLCIGRGFYYKNVYRNSESFSSRNVNAYVGGDAYNYIINGTYFVGFVTMGSFSGMGGIVLLGAAELLKYKKTALDTQKAEQHEEAAA